MSWARNFLGGHLNIGKKITIFGANAMNWRAEISTKRFGYIVFTLPTWARIKKGDWEIYCSPNATPWASTFYRATFGDCKKRKIRALIRKLNFGHNFSTQKNYDRLHVLNEKFASLLILDYDVENWKG